MIVIAILLYILPFKDLLMQSIVALILVSGFAFRMIFLYFKIKYEHYHCASRNSGNSRNVEMSTVSMSCEFLGFITSAIFKFINDLNWSYARACLFLILRKQILFLNLSLKCF